MHRHVVTGEAERSTLLGSRDSRITKARITACAPKQEESFIYVRPTHPNLGTCRVRPKFPRTAASAWSTGSNDEFPIPLSGIALDESTRLHVHSGRCRKPAIAVQLRQRSGTRRPTHPCVASLRRIRVTLDPTSISTVLQLSNASRYAGHVASNVPILREDLHAAPAGCAYANEVTRRASISH